MTWNWAVLMPHPPILVPEVGQGREQEAKKTLRGIDQLLARLGENQAEKGPVDCLFVLSPHQPYAQGALCINCEQHYFGSLAPFGAPEIAFSLAPPDKEPETLIRYLSHHKIPVVKNVMNDITPDHGTLVPLYFLSRLFPGGKLPPVLLASPIGLSPDQAFGLGKILARFTDEKRWGFVASGDLSHKLLPDAPAGYHPDGKRFDQTLVEALRKGTPSPFSTLPISVLENAGECGLRSVMTLLGLVQAPLEVCSYEGPFGVGYCNAVAVLANKEKKSEPAQPVSGFVADGDQILPLLARLTVTRYLAGDVDTPWDIPHNILQSSIWKEPGACFVSIKTRSGDLRGCIGTLAATQDSLGQEIMHNAISAATQDSRFLPMTMEELDNVVFSVDVLGAPKPVTSLEDLDPEVWGVIVSKGGRRGVLLPALEGVTSVEQQLDIATRKAGLDSWQGANIQRFSVERFKEHKV